MEHGAKVKRQRYRKRAIDIDRENVSCSLLTPYFFLFAIIFLTLSHSHVP